MVSISVLLFSACLGYFGCSLLVCPTKTSPHGFPRLFLVFGACPPTTYILFPWFTALSSGGICNICAVPWHPPLLPTAWQGGTASKERCVQRCVSQVGLGFRPPPLPGRREGFSPSSSSMCTGVLPLRSEDTPGKHLEAHAPTRDHLGLCPQPSPTEAPGSRVQLRAAVCSFCMPWSRIYRSGLHPARGLHKATCKHCFLYKCQRVQWLKEWVEASSCSCERVFSFMTQSDFGQPVGAGRVFHRGSMYLPPSKSPPCPHLYETRMNCTLPGLLHAHHPQFRITCLHAAHE